MLYNLSMNRLSEIRKQYNLKQQQLAEILGVKQQQVSRWEVVGISPLALIGIESVLKVARQSDDKVMICQIQKI